jgi:hypothetical protein
MTFQVTAPFAVSFIDLETESGTRTLRGRVEGRLDASGEEEAAEKVRAAIRERYPVCWSMKIGSVRAVEVG